MTLAEAFVFAVSGLTRQNTTAYKHVASKPRCEALSWRMAAPRRCAAVARHLRDGRGVCGVHVRGDVSWVNA